MKGLWGPAAESDLQLTFKEKSSFSIKKAQICITPAYSAGLDLLSSRLFVLYLSHLCPLDVFVSWQKPETFLLCNLYLTWRCLCQTGHFSVPLSPSCHTRQTLEWPVAVWGVKNRKRAPACRKSWYINIATVPSPFLAALMALHPVFSTGRNPGRHFIMFYPPQGPCSTLSHRSYSSSTDWVWICFDLPSQELIRADGLYKCWRGDRMQKVHYRLVLWLQL